MDVKAEIFENMMVLTTDKKRISVTPEEPFTTARLLVGTFMPAVNCMKDGLQQVGATGLLKRKPNLIIFPMAFAEGGLSEIEERCLLEVGYSAGAGEVEVQV